DPCTVLSRPYIEVAEIFNDGVKLLCRNGVIGAKAFDIRVWGFISARPQDLDCLVAAQPPVSDLQGKIVKGARKAELVPFQVVMERDELIIDVGIVVETCPGPLLASPECMCLCFCEDRVGI